VAVGSVYETAKARPFVRIDEKLMREAIEPAILGAPTAGKRAPSLKAVITRCVDLGPTVVDHCLRLAGLRPNTKCSNYISEQHLLPLLEAFVGVQQQLLATATADKHEDAWQAPEGDPPAAAVPTLAPPTSATTHAPAPAVRSRGYIIQRGNGQVRMAKRGDASLAAAAAISSPSSAGAAAERTSGNVAGSNPAAAAATPDVAAEATQAARESVLSAVSGSTTAAKEVGAGVVYDAVVPMLYKQYEGRSALEFESFDEAVDEFFSRLEGQRLEGRQQTAESKVMRKLDKMVSNQHQRIERFAADEALFSRKAQRIEERVDDVDRAITIIQSALSSGLDWNEVSHLRWWC
jgi:hypothetical protein